jgi:hypothetical protein
MRTGQEVQPIKAFAMGIWYEKHVPGTNKVFQFMLLEPVRRMYQDERHGCQCLLKDGSTALLVWRPENARVAPGWLRRQWEKFAGNPLLAVAAPKKVVV